MTFQWLSFGRASFFSPNACCRASDFMYEKDALQQQYSLWGAAIIMPQMKFNAIVG
jgi:hypothetical protein